MKEINIYIPYEKLKEANDILLRYNVSGISFYDINGKGRAQISEYVQIVDGYATGRKFTPDFQSRAKIEVVVSDSKSKQIVEELIHSLNAGPNTIGKIFVKDVPEAYDIGTKESGEKAISI